MTPNQLNRNTRDSVVSLLTQASFSEDSSVINQLECMNFDAPAEPTLRAENAELKAKMSGVDERVAFEAAYLKANYPRVAAGELSAPPIFGRVGSMKFHGQAEGDYECSDVQTCWVIWQARAQLPSQEAKASPTEVPYALRQWAMDDEPESTLFDEGYNAARRWVKMQLEKPAEPTEKILWYTGNTADPTDAVEVVGYLYAVCDDLLLDHQKPNLPHEPLMTVAQHERLMAAKDGDVVKVPRELLVKLLDEGRRAETWAAQDELRALLGGAA